MKCQLRISTHCKKVFRKEKVKYIENKTCCANCYWLRKFNNKLNREEEKKNGYWLKKPKKQNVKNKK